MARVTNAEIAAKLDRIENARQFASLLDVGLGMRTRISFSLTLLGIGLILQGMASGYPEPQWALGLLGWCLFIVFLLSMMAAHAVQRACTMDPGRVERFMENFSGDAVAFEQELWDFLETDLDNPGQVRAVRRILSIVRKIEQHPWLVSVAFAGLLIAWIAWTELGIRFLSG